MATSGALVSFRLNHLTRTLGFWTKPHDQLSAFLMLLMLMLNKRACVTYYLYLVSNHVWDLFSANGIFLYTWYLHISFTKIFPVCQFFLLLWAHISFTTSLIARIDQAYPGLLDDPWLSYIYIALGKDELPWLSCCVALNSVCMEAACV